MKKGNVLLTKRHFPEQWKEWKRLDKIAEKGAQQTEIRQKAKHGVNWKSPKSTNGLLEMLEGRKE
jgi:hypothetical protein